MMVYRVFWKSNPMVTTTKAVSYETYHDDYEGAKKEAEAFAIKLKKDGIKWARIYITEMTALTHVSIYDLDCGWLDGTLVRDVVSYEYEAGSTNHYIEKFPDKNMRMLILNAKLQGEAGEFSDALGKLYRDYGGEAPGEYIQELVLELGDIAWYIVALSQELGYSLQEVLLLNILKLKKRYKEK